MEFKQRFKGRYNFVDKEGQEKVLLSTDSNPVPKMQDTSEIQVD